VTEERQAGTRAPAEGVHPEPVRPRVHPETVRRLDRATGALGTAAIAATASGRGRPTACATACRIFTGNAYTSRMTILKYVILPSSDNKQKAGSLNPPSEHRRLELCGG